MKRVLILKEHHGTHYLDVSTEEKLHAVALSVVRGRFGCKNPYYPMEELTPPVIPFTDAELAAVPESLKDEAKKKCERYKSEWQAYKRAFAFQAAVKDCLEKQDGKLAWRILQSREGYEDECLTIEDVDDEYHGAGEEEE